MVQILLPVPVLYTCGPQAPSPASENRVAQAPSPARKCLSLRHHEPSKQAARSIEREVFSFQQLLFYCSQATASFRPIKPLLPLVSIHRFFGIDQPLLSLVPISRSPAGANATKGESEMGTAAHGHDRKKKQATQSRKFLMTEESPRRDAACCVSLEDSRKG
jgi:hypothetical protein